MSVKNTTRVTKAELVQLNSTLAAENEALRAELSALRGDVERFRKQLHDDRNAKEQLYSEAQQLRAQIKGTEQPRQAPDTSERRAQIDALKAFAKKYRCLSRIGEGGNIELYSRKRSCWVAVPEGAQP